MAKTVIHNLFGIKRVKGECVYMNTDQHEQHWAWLRKKAQAHFRKEEWSLTIEEWFKLWEDSGMWHNRGRHKDASAVFMRDPELGWHMWNVEVCNRSIRLGEMNSGNPRMTGRPKKNGY